jgi:predicted permease
VLAFTASATLFTGLLFGLAPAIRGTRVDLNQSLRDTGSAATSSGGRLNFAKLLVIAQVGLSLLMAVGAGLFLRTLWNLQAVDLGYSRENLLLASFDPLTAGYKDARAVTLYRDLADRLRALPGVQGVTYSALGLFSGSNLGLGVEVEGFTPAGTDRRGSGLDVVGPAYFSTLGVPMRLGREIGPQDTASSPKVCVINDAFAKVFFANRNPIGLHVTRVFGDNRVTMEVIGVAANAHDQQLREDVPPRFFLPTDQAPAELQNFVNVLVRASGDPQQMLNTIRKTILSLNSDMVVADTHSLGQSIYDFNAEERMIARLCTLFGVVALLLAGIGLYGVLSYGVARRTNEIGIRIALGAGRARVITMILRETGTMIVIGVAAGLVSVVALTRFVAARLYGLSSLDPTTIAMGVCILGTVALAAGYLPAARAARVNPVKALRHE